MLVEYLAAAAAAGFVGGALGFILAGVASFWRLWVVEMRLKRVEGALTGALGPQKKAETSARQAEAIGKAMAIIQNPEIQDKKTSLMGLCAEYPDVAAGLIKQFGLKL